MQFKKIVEPLFAKFQKLILDQKRAKTGTFEQIWHQKGIFLCKMTVLSYKTNVLSILVQFYKICGSFFLAKSKNTVILVQKRQKLVRLAEFRQNKIFFSKKLLCYLFPLLSPHFNAKFRKKSLELFLRLIQN